MGGIPGEAVISIAIPGTIEVEYLDQLYEGMKSMARQFDVNLLGGDTTSSPQHLVINVALVGWAAEDEVLYRSGAKAGDVIFLTGAVGTSAAGLDLILSGKHFSRRDALLEAHHNPLPQIKEGRIIAGLRVANSLIDVSDGVASDLGHICDESGVGAVLEESRIPVTDAFRTYCSEFQLDCEKLMLHVGEDYVLLGSVPAESADKLRNALESAGSTFHPIGTIVGARGSPSGDPMAPPGKLRPAASIISGNDPGMMPLGELKRPRSSRGPVRIMSTVPPLHRFRLMTRRWISEVPSTI